MEICADWKESIARRRQRLLLRAELIGGVDEEEVEEVRQDAALRADGATVPEIMRRTKLSKASVYRALGGATQAAAG